MSLPYRTFPGLDGIGKLAQPASGSIDAVVFRDRKSGNVRLDFSLNGARLAVTDAAASGSFAAFKFFEFEQQALSVLGSRQDYTKFREGAALTGGAGDAAFEIGIGTTAIAAAADGTLGNGTNENIGQAVAVTLSSGTGAGSAVNGAGATAFNGTAAGVSLNLNWSGTAATIDASSTIDVWGTVSVSIALLGDD